MDLSVKNLEKDLLQRVCQEKPVYLKALKINFSCGIFSFYNYFAYLSFLKNMNRLNQTVNLYE